MVLAVASVLEIVHWLHVRRRDVLLFVVAHVGVGEKSVKHRDRLYVKVEWRCYRARSDDCRSPPMAQAVRILREIRSAPRRRMIRATWRHRLYERSGALIEPEPPHESSKVYFGKRDMCV
jgi:hypothetical protein